MTPLTLECRQLITGVLITVAGEIDCSNADRLESYTTRMRRSGQPLVLDLSGLSFMDSSGLHTLLRLNAAAHPQGLYLAAVHPMPARVLQITKVEDVMNIHPTVEEAVTAALNGDVASLPEAP
ncbi:STAS domain-containing protein [Nonomuraea sp. NPDC049695]|uniref:STAS domain-containing protein n=1 Tax=Nonomuraea sp. NPDC049695 TaxID=3154734 RepID=UPI003427552A